jgi:hypothetical protein
VRSRQLSDSIENNTYFFFFGELNLYLSRKCVVSSLDRKAARIDISSEILGPFNSIVAIGIGELQQDGGNRESS